MGLFVYTKKGSIISTVYLPTTEIIEPEFVGYVVMSRKAHLVVIGIVSVIYLCGMIVSLMF